MSRESQNEIDQLGRITRVLSRLTTEIFYRATNES